MKININKAISIFHPNPSYEQVYFESVANAIDACAERISIQIKIESFDKPETIELIIEDNGIGFSDKNFEKFSKLLEVESTHHKGLGRLVYLSYFKEVKIESIYKESDRLNKREFVFNSKFTGKENTVVSLSEEKESGSILNFTSYSRGKVYSYAYLTPEKIKDSLIRQFFPLLFKKK
jgi:DNA topoisomerase VI subunit B